jgi:hypothetical protein
LLNGNLPALMFILLISTLLTASIRFDRFSNDTIGNSSNQK